MKTKYIVFVVTTLLIAIGLLVDAKRVAMIPLSARDVYRILKDAGREDAVPEGRVVTEGLAAITGLAVGLVKGIGGTALLGPTVLNLLTGNSNQQQQQTQEICFNSRSLNEIYDGEEEDVRANDPSGRQNTGTGTGTNTVTTPTTTTTPTTVTTTTPTTITVQPSTTGTNTGTNTDTGTGTNVNTGTNTGTATGTTTQTGTGGSVNCVVIQQPPTAAPIKLG